MVKLLSFYDTYNNSNKLSDAFESIPDGDRADEKDAFFRNLGG